MLDRAISNNFVLLLKMNVSLKSIAAKSNSMSEKIKAPLVIFTNSLVYFLLGYFFVVTTTNLFSIFLANLAGFDGVLFYYGFELHEHNAHWGKGNIVLIFGLGNSLTLFWGFVFSRWYKAIKRRYIKAKLLIMWIAIISFTWFLGNIMVGAFFNFGIGAAMLALSIPLFIRIIAALVAFVLLFWLGYKFQREIYISANLYYRQFTRKKQKVFIFQQIVFPALIGFVLIVVFKYPYSIKFQYLDMLCLLPVLFIGIGSLSEKNYHLSSGKSLKQDTFLLNYRALIFLAIFLTVYRIVLGPGWVM